MYCFENARDPVQLERMRVLAAVGLCYFCPESFDRLDVDNRPVLHTEYWIVTHNDFPYPGTSKHFLLVPRQHSTAMHLLSPRAQSNFWVALGSAVEVLGLTHYSLGVRCGYPKFTGATIEHVHVHLLVASEEPDAPPLRMRFSPKRGK